MKFGENSSRFIFHSKPNSSKTESSQSMGESDVWIFGYGSLCWNPGFEYTEALVGYVKGYRRTFWQGSVTHRGTSDRPGRVATLIRDDESIAWGVVFKISSSRAAFPYLERRECLTGGYKMHAVQVNVPAERRALNAVTYVAFADNYLWQGEASLAEVSDQIATCAGESGHNAEYLLKLADFVRREIPQDLDPELFQLETLTKERLKASNLRPEDFLAAEDDDAGVKIKPRPKDSFLACFADTVAKKKLKCVNRE